MPADEQQYGYDADGNIVVAREHVGSDGAREELRLARGETVVGYRWSETGEPSEVNVARFSGGKIRSYVTVRAESRTDTLRGWSSERYEYGGELVTEISTSRRSRRRIPPKTADRDRRTRFAGRAVEMREQGGKVLFRYAGGRRGQTERARRRSPSRDGPSSCVASGNETIYCLVGLSTGSRYPNLGLGLEPRSPRVDERTRRETSGSRWEPGGAAINAARPQRESATSTPNRPSHRRDSPGRDRACVPAVRPSTAPLLDSNSWMAIVAS